jgi:hypothetical protein
MRIIRRPELRTLTIAGMAAALAIIALCLLLVWRTQSAQTFREQSAANCQAIEQIKTSIRETFMVSLHRQLERDNLDAAERATIRKSYEEELSRYAPVECPSP